MGQSYSSETEVAMGIETDLREQISLPLCLPTHKTTVWQLGQLQNDQGYLWHLIGGRKAFPFLGGYRASCEVYDRKYELIIDTVDSGSVIFKAIGESGKEFRGSSPTAPFAKIALYHRRFDVVNGMEAFGLLSPYIQLLLRSAAKDTGQLDQLVSTAQGVALQQHRPTVGSSLIANRVGEAVLSGQQQSALVDLLAAAGQQSPPRQVATDGTARKLPSTAPSLQNWLGSAPSLAGALSLSRQGQQAQQAQATERGIGASQDEEGQEGVPQQGTPHARGLEVPIQAANESHLPALNAAVWPHPTHSGGRSSRPASRSAFSADVDYTPQPPPSRPHSRSRRRPPPSGPRSGKGWTAFTAFGLEMRDVVRAEAPWATATEVEKLVGQRWAALTPPEKQKYADAAARVRKQMGGAAGTGGATSARVVAQEALEEGGLQGDEGVGIKRSRSDATNLTNSLSEERPLRHVRPNRQYASDYYETPDWQGMLGAEGLGDEGADERGGDGRAAGKGRRRAAHPGSKSRLSREGGGKGAEELDGSLDEDDVLGLLTSMREQAISTDERAAEAAAASDKGGLREGNGDSAVACKLLHAAPVIGQHATPEGLAVEQDANGGMGGSREEGTMSHGDEAHAGTSPTDLASWKDDEDGASLMEGGDDRGQLNDAGMSDGENSHPFTGRHLLSLRQHSQHQDA